MDQRHFRVWWQDEFYSFISERMGLVDAQRLEARIRRYHASLIEQGRVRLLVMADRKTFRHWDEVAARTLVSFSSGCEGFELYMINATLAGAVAAMRPPEPAPQAEQPADVLTASEPRRTWQGRLAACCCSPIGSEALAIAWAAANVLGLLGIGWGLDLFFRWID